MVYIYKHEVYNRARDKHMFNTKKLVIKAQGGDKEAFGKLYDELYSKVYGYSYKKTFNHAHSGDITANTFVRLLESLHKFTWVNEAAFHGWVFRLANNEVSNFFKKQNKYNLNTDYFDSDSTNLLEDIKQKNIKEEVDKNLDKARLHSAMKKLKSHEKQILELYYFADMSHKHIAQHMDIKEGNVRVIAHRASKKLKDLLQTNQLIAERTD